MSGETNVYTAPLLSDAAARSGRDLAFALSALFGGCLLVYLVMFDQGATLDLLLGRSSDEGFFHQLFHDGRHLNLFPCH